MKVVVGLIIGALILAILIYFASMSEGLFESFIEIFESLTT